MKLQVEYVPIDELKAYENNAKIHTAEQIEQIKKSIQEFGMNDPIAVWKDNEIIEGHGRLIALKELGFTEAPIIRLDNLSDEERRAYALVHNKLTMNTGFDLDILGIELESLSFDMEKFGFDTNDVEFEDDSYSDNGVEYKEKISVLIECKTESEAEKLFNEMSERGYQCRISTL